MRDGVARRALKGVARWHFRLEQAVIAAVRRRRGDRPWKLAGRCRRAARCCEEPAIQVGWLVRYLPTVRRLFLWWQRHVNGFHLLRRDGHSRVLVFRCTHFDRQTRRCDSYGSRPGMCRDYPRPLLDQAAPELFPECGYRAVAAGADGMLAALARESLTEEQMEKLTRELRLK